MRNTIRVAAWAIAGLSSSSSVALAEDCFPTCRSGFVCAASGRCVSACNPACETGSTCARGECVPQPAATQPTGAGASSVSPGGAVGTAATAAEAYGRRTGFYARLALGLGVPRASASFGYGDSWSGFGLGAVGEILLGGSVRPGLAIGGGIVLNAHRIALHDESGDNSDGGQLYLAQTLGVFADYYPNPTRGLHYQGFGGLLFLKNGFNRTHPGISGALGVGYDWWLSNFWSIGVLGRLEVAHATKDDVGTTLVVPAVLLAFTYY